MSFLAGFSESNILKWINKYNDFEYNRRIKYTCKSALNINPFPNTMQFVYLKDLFTKLLVIYSSG